MTRRRGAREYDRPMSSAGNTPPSGENVDLYLGIWRRTRDTPSRAVNGALQRVAGLIRGVRPSEIVVALVRDD